MLQDFALESKRNMREFGIKRQPQLLLNNLDNFITAAATS